MVLPLFFYSLYECISRKFCLDYLVAVFIEENIIIFGRYLTSFPQQNKFFKFVRIRILEVKEQLNSKIILSQVIKNNA